jgi:hypothetical protein
VENVLARAPGGRVHLDSPSPCAAMRSQQRRAAIQKNCYAGGCALGVRGEPVVLAKPAYANQGQVNKAHANANYGRKSLHSAPVAASTLSGKRRPSAEFATAKRLRRRGACEACQWYWQHLRTTVSIDKLKRTRMSIKIWSKVHCASPGGSPKWCLLRRPHGARSQHGPWRG